MRHSQLHFPLKIRGYRVRLANPFLQGNIGVRMEVGKLHFKKSLFGKNSLYPDLDHLYLEAKDEQKIE